MHFCMSQTLVAQYLSAGCPHVLFVQAKEIQLALRSGVHSSVAWSLNVLTVLSFNATHPLLLSQHSGLLQALLEVSHSHFFCLLCMSASDRTQPICEVPHSTPILLLTGHALVQV